MPNPKISWAKFGKDVRFKRGVYGISLRDAALTLGIDKSTLSRAERGRPISPEWFVWLAGWVGKSAEKYLA